MGPFPPNTTTWIFSIQLCICEPVPHPLCTDPYNLSLSLLAFTLTKWYNNLKAQFTFIHHTTRVCTSRASHHMFLHQSYRRSRWRHCSEGLVGRRCCSYTSSHSRDTLNAGCNPTHLKHQDTGAARHKHPTQAHTQNHPHTPNLLADILMVEDVHLSVSVLQRNQPGAI